MADGISAMPNHARSLSFSSGLLLALALPSLVTGCNDSAPLPGDESQEGSTTDAQMTDGTGDLPGDEDPMVTSVSGSTGSLPDPDTGEVTEGSAGTDSGDDGPTTGEPACENDPELLCLDPAPEGWVGPVAMSSDPALTQSHCGGGYPELETTAFSGFFAPADDCGCDCGSPHGGGCSGSADLGLYPMNFNIYHSLPFPHNQVSNVQFCHTSGGTIDLADNVFTAVNQSLPSRFRLDVQSLAASGGECTPITTGSIPDAGFSERVDLCAPAELEPGCDDTVCVPKPAPPFEAGVCIWQEGNHECPADAGYTERTVYHRNFEDTRSCSSCSCSAPSGSCPDAEATLYFGYNFVDVVTLEDGQCIMVASADHDEVTAARFYTGNPEWEPCQASQGGSNGEATPIEPITVCCTQ